METKPIVDKINTNVSLSKKTHAAITKKAKELGITNSRLINTLCINYAWLMASWLVLIALLALVVERKHD